MLLLFLSLLWGDQTHPLRRKLEEAALASTLAAFFIMSIIPHQALAFAQQVETPWHPLVFEFPHGQVRKLLSADGSYFSPQDLDIRGGMMISVLASGYSSTVAQTDGDPYTTAAGTRVRDGVVAANFLPLGTRLLWGEKELVVEDRLNGRYDETYMIDVWMPSTEQALQFGVQLITVKVMALPVQ